MSDLLAYIESYFNGELDSGARREFETRCETDESFAKEVAFYVSSRQVIREDLLEKKKSEWQTPVREINEAKVVRFGIRNILKYAAVAVLLVAAFTLYYSNKTSPRQLAESYIKSNYGYLPQLMGGGDSVAIGKEAYNKKDIAKAETIFTAFSAAHPESADAKEYAGLVYLVKGDYDKAITYFDQLSEMQNLYSNPGLILKASALLLRNNKNDEAIAKVLLRQIVNKNLEGKPDAEKWLKRL